MRFLLAITIAAISTTFVVAGPTDGMTKGTPTIKSISTIAFGPEGVLFLGDPVNATIFAIATNDTQPAGKDDVKLDKINETISSMLGIPADQLTLNDMKVNPASGNIYLAVTRGKTANATPVLLKLSRDGKLSEFALQNVSFSSVKIPNATDRNRNEAITGIGYVSGKVIVAGLSNEEFASTLRSIPFPFKESGRGSSVEIFHGAHGRFETNAPIRTFVSYKVADREEILAAYTCTPLVRIPVEDLQPGAKVKGKTIAELGNRNRPLDMIVYSKDGKDFILMANSARGVMKIPAAEFAGAEAITKRPATEKAGVSYETITGLKGVEHLDKLDETRAVMIVKNESGALNLTTVPLP